MLEVVVHLPSIRFVRGLVAARLHVPDDAGVETVTAAELPDDRFSEEAAAWLRRRGDAWLQAGEALALVAPSVIVPHEENVMLNPRHPRADRVRVEEIVPFSLDEPMFGG